MKIISLAILGIGLLSVSTAHGLECEVRYKAKKIVIEKFFTPAC